MSERRAELVDEDVTLTPNKEMIVKHISTNYLRWNVQLDAVFFLMDGHDR